MQIPHRRVSVIALSVAATTACDLDPPRRPDQGFLVYTTTLAAHSHGVEFSGIGAVDVDSRGEIYVVDIPNTLTLLDSTGAFVRKVGSAGDGPGEFRRIADLQVLQGDSVMLFDSDLSRVTIYAPGQSNPSVVRSFERTGHDFALQFMRYSDGSQMEYYAPALGPYAGTPERNPQYLRATTESGKPIGAVALPGSEILSFSDGQGMTFVLPRFARRTLVALTPEYAYSLWNDSAAVRVFDRRGNLVSTFRPEVPSVNAPISAADYDTAVAGFGSAQAKRSIGSRVESRWQTWPMYEAMLVDDRRDLWIKPVSRVGPNRWYRLAADGSRRGHVDLPVNAVPRVIKNDRIYCVVKDELDVQTIAVYAVTRSAPTSIALK